MAIIANSDEARGQMANAHSRTHPGKRVRIKLRDGTVIFGRFKEYRSTYTEIELDGKARRLNNDDIVSFSIFKKETP